MTWTMYWGGGLTVLFGLGMKPESMEGVPGLVLESLMQGVLKADCVSVWFSDMKVNATMSPTAASIVGGE